MKWVNEKKDKLSLYNEGEGMVNVCVKEGTWVLIIMPNFVINFSQTRNWARW